MTDILHIITALNRGGAENHLADLVHGQLAAGHRVGVAYLKGDGWWAEALRRAGAEVVALGMRRWIDPLALARLVSATRAFRPTVIHGHLTPAEPYAWAVHALAGRGAALVISKHNDDPFGYERGYGPVTRRFTTHARRVIAISDAVARFLPPLGVDPSRIRVIHYGLDGDRWRRPDSSAVAQLRASWGGEVIIGCVARLVPQKAHDVLFAGFARAARPSWRLVLVGSGPLEAGLRAEAERIGIGPQVVWAGQRSDMAEVMGAFDAFALTSIYEGLGLVLLEAMAAARPVVASAVSAIPEIVGDDGAAGVLVPPRDPEALAAALRRITDPATAAAMGAAGQLRVARRFSLAKMVAATDAAYTEALACAE
jgi:glycosyltransferase involved in cell wall biosynthesis